MVCVVSAKLGRKVRVSQQTSAFLPESTYHETHFRVSIIREQTECVCRNDTGDTSLPPNDHI